MSNSPAEFYMTGVKTGVKSALDFYMGKIKKEEKMIDEGVKPSKISEYGIISPDGDFYKCEYWMHDALCIAVGFNSKDDAKKNGWIIVSSHPIKGSWVDINNEEKSFTMTDNQREVLEKWSNGFDYSKYVEKYNLLRDDEIRL